MGDLPRAIVSQRRTLWVTALAVLAMLLAAPPSWAQRGTWTLVDSTYNLLYYGVACADSLNCVVTGNNGNEQTVIRRSTDAGRTWRGIFLDTLNRTTHRFPPTIREVAYPTPNLCLGVTDSGTVIRTTDAGASWSVTQVDSIGLEHIYMSDSLNGVIPTYGRLLLRTSDGGATWVSAGFPDSLRKSSIVHAIMPSSRTIIVLTAYDAGKGPTQLILRSDDLGATWQSYPTPFVRFVWYINFIDTNRGWAAGAKGFSEGEQHDLIYNTTDGGRTWQLQLDTLNPIGYGLDQIAFVDNLHGIACGQTPKILRTSDGGITWKRDTVPMGYISPISVHAIAYPSPAYALAVTTQGQILRYAEMPAAVHEPNISETTRDLLYPNPISPGATLTIPGTESANEISIIDPLGRVVLHDATPVSSRGGSNLAFTLDPAIPPGLYLIRIQATNTIRTLPFIVR